MSLKKFHIFFMSISAFLCLGLIYWGIQDFRLTRHVFSLILAFLGAAGVVFVVGYLKWFLQKFAKITTALMVCLVMIAAYFHSSDLWACSTCYKDPDSPLTKAAISGVWFLLVVILGMLAAILYFAISWKRKAKALNRPL